MNDSVVHTIVSASRPVRIAATVALSALALFLLILAFQALSDFGRSDKPITSTISVTGTGKSTAVPNIAQISFTVQESASTVAAAQDAATKRSNDALKAVKDLGIADKDVQTTGYNISPQYAERTCPAGAACAPSSSNTIVGYQVLQSVTLKVRDTAKAGDVLKKLGTLGVQNISGPNFMLDDDSTVRAEARKEAIADAREKAEVLAKQLDVRLGTVVSFSESGNYPVYSSYTKGGVAMDAAATPSLPVGESDTNVTVNITYEIR